MDFCFFGHWDSEILFEVGDRDAYMEAEGHTASATTCGGLEPLAPECYDYFVLSPAGTGLIMLVVRNQNILKKIAKSGREAGFCNFFPPGSFFNRRPMRGIHLYQFVQHFQFLTK